MFQTDIYQSVIDFLDIFDTPFSTEEQAIEKLAIVLDQLTFALHFVRCIFEPHWPDPPDESYTIFREQVQQRFPSFGFYNMPTSITKEIATTSINVGDAIDDIVDIASELSKVRWRWHNTSSNNALWHLEFGYQNHFGWHIRKLQSYIYALTNKI